MLYENMGLSPTGYVPPAAGGTWMEQAEKKDEK